jgi:hypothetical protein
VQKSTIEVEQHRDYLLRFGNDSTGGYGYKNANGAIVIASRKYLMCFTDTFKTYAIVATDGGYIGIDRQENVLYKVFPYDNGPDYAPDGLFRITENNKIGFADAATGAIVIQPLYECAAAFNEGSAKVSYACTAQPIGEYFTYHSNNWFYIDKTGKKVTGLKKQRVSK